MTDDDAIRIRFRDLLDRLSRNDPTVTHFAMDEYQFQLDPEEAIRLGTALQNSSHVKNVTFVVTCIPSVASCSTLVPFLSSSSRLETIRFLGSLDIGVTEQEAQRAAQIANVLFPAAQRNPFVKNLEMCITGFINQALHHIVRNLIPISSSSLRSVKLVNPRQRTFSSMLSGNGIPNFVTFLCHYANHIESLALDRNYIGEEGIMALANLLPTNQSLIELCLNDCSVGAAGVRAIFAALQQNETLKIVRLQKVYIDFSPLDDLEEFMDDSEDLCNALVEYLPQCQLEILELTRNIPFRDDFFCILHDQDALLRAFQANRTLKEIDVCSRIMDETLQPELVFCALRNIFQPYIASGLKNSLTSSVLDGHSRTDKYPSRVSTIPLGLWPFLLEVADRRYPNAALLHMVLSSRLDLFFACII
jgi:hypothetical protein